MFRNADLGPSDDPPPEDRPETLFDASELPGADFTDANLTKAVFRNNTNLTEAIFEEACLTGADLTGATGLQASQFDRAYVAGARFPETISEQINGVSDECPPRP